jgi:hypothetical protein
VFEGHTAVIFRGKGFAIFAHCTGLTPGGAMTAPMMLQSEPAVL